MARDFNAVPVHLRSWRAHVRRCPLARRAGAEQLRLNGDREVLILAHCLRRLTVQHHTVVPQRPSWTALYLLADEAIVHRDDVMRELLACVEQVSKMRRIPEIHPLVIRHDQKAVLYPERVAV